MKSARGFTLIELLVVIAIIGILASLILVSLGSARNKGKDTRILSDLNQILDQLEIESNTSGGYLAGDGRCLLQAAQAYGSLNVTGSGKSPNCSTLVADITSMGGEVRVSTSPSSGTHASYTAFAVFAIGNDKQYCVDSLRNQKEYSIADSFIPGIPCPSPSMPVM